MPLRGLVSKFWVTLCLLTATAQIASAGQPAAVLQSIAVLPANPSAAAGRTVPFTALGTFSDGSVQNLTASVTWTSSVTPVATVSNASGSEGLVSALQPGTSAISARRGVVTGSTTLTVTSRQLDDIELTPVAPRVDLGQSIQFSATGVYSDGTTQDLTAQAIWSSTVTTVAVVSNAAGSQGLARTVGIGTTEIEARLGTLVASATLTVTDTPLVALDLMPISPSIAVGHTQQFTATGEFADGTKRDLTDRVTWSSSLPNVATVSNAAGAAGLATGLRTGTALIGARFGTIVASPVTLTVSNTVLVAIEVTPVGVRLPAGYSLQLVATGTFSDGTTLDLSSSATWSSSDQRVARVSNTKSFPGRVTGVTAGSARISARWGTTEGSTLIDVTNASLVAIDVSPKAVSTQIGRTVQFTATGSFSDFTTLDLTDTVTWASSQHSVARISNARASNGLATALGEGTTQIRARWRGISATTSLTATDVDLIALDVIPINPSIVVGQTLQFIVTGRFSDGSAQDVTDEVAWSSSDRRVARISNANKSSGLATSVGAGTAAITARWRNVVGSTSLVVTDATLIAIEVRPANATLGVGRTVQFTAVGIYSDGTTQALTDKVSWSSSDRRVARVSNAQASAGSTTGSGIGTTEIRARWRGVEGTATVIVQ